MNGTNPSQAEDGPTSSVSVDAMGCENCRIAENATTSGGSLAAAYVRWRRSPLGQITDRLEHALMLEAAAIESGARILDVGCGDGALTVRLAAAGGSVTGLDGDARMLAAADARAKREGVALTLVEGDAARMPFDRHRFDVVIASAVLCHAPKRSVEIAEMARVLRPGGRLVVGDLGA